MAKMNRKWVALCTTAIGTIYAAGYFTTETDAALRQPPLTQEVAQVQPQTPQAQQQMQQDRRPQQSQQFEQHGEQSGRDSDQHGEAFGDRNTKPNSQPQPSQTPAPANVQHTSPSGNTYKDGSYEGAGRNRRGSIQVTVTIKNHKISDVEISRFAMHYSERDVVGLPDEVLKNQNAQVKNVSGATYSTEAFEEAVQDALSHALNA